MKYSFFEMIKWLLRQKPFSPLPNWFMIKMPVVVLLVPRSGILITTAGKKNTRPWYKIINPLNLACVRICAQYS